MVRKAGPTPAACRKMRNVSATQEGDDAHRQQRKLDLKSEPFFRTPKLLWVSGRLRRRGDGACCECEPRVLLRVGVAALDHGIACEMKYIVLEAAAVKYHSRKMFCIDSNIIRGQG